MQEMLRDMGSIPGPGRSPRGGHGNPLQYFCLKNPTDRGAWWAMVHRAAQSWTWLSNLAHTHTGIVMKVSSHRHNQLLTLFPALLPSPETWGRGGNWNFQASNHNLGFLVTSLLPRAHPELPHYNKRHSYSPGDYKSFKGSVSWTGNWDQYIFYYYFRNIPA